MFNNFTKLRENSWLFKKYQQTEMFTIKKLDKHNFWELLHIYVALSQPTSNSYEQDDLTTVHNSSACLGFASETAFLTFSIALSTKDWACMWDLNPMQGSILLLLWYFIMFIMMGQRKRKSIQNLIC